MYCGGRTLAKIVGIAFLDPEEGRTVVPANDKGNFEIWLPRYSSRFPVDAESVVIYYRRYDPVLCLDDGTSERVYQGGISNESGDNMRVAARCLIDKNDRRT